MFVMACLSISLLGPQQILLDGCPLIGLATDKIRALLIYLAVEQDRPHRRSALVGLLWPDTPEAAARHSLSQALFVLRRALGDRQIDSRTLVSTRQDIQFNNDSDHRLDVAAFASLIQSWGEHPQPSLCDANIARLQRALAIYRGDFLSQFFLADSTAFEEWALLKREHYHRLIMDTLQRLTLHHKQREEYAAAAQYLRRQIALEPWHEAAYYHLMQLLARDDQRGAALACYASCCRALSTELGVAPSLEIQALYQQIAAGDRRCAMPADILDCDANAVAPARARPIMLPHNVPPAQMPIIGRENELALIATSLANPDCRLLTVTGPGGVGKTCLALQIARQIVATNDLAFIDGIYLISYTPLCDAVSGAFSCTRDNLIAPLATALGILHHGAQDQLGQVSAFLHNKRMLLILDNFEHLIGQIEVLTEIIGKAPGVTILVTSRERLNVQEEWAIPIAGLSIPTIRKEPPTVSGAISVEAATPADFEASTAVQLFLQQVYRLQPTFIPDAADRLNIARICALVNCLPLGIQLAAAWVPMLSCAEIADEITHDLDMLRTSLHNHAERHQSMRAVFTHSWQLLSEAEQRTLAALSVFRSGFDRAAAVQVAGASLFLLASLESKSLLQRNSATQRYEIHELLRRYAAEQLAIQEVNR
jgi:DNA-binding SARP family transcriptional activator